MTTLAAKRIDQGGQPRGGKRKAISSADTSGSTSSQRFVWDASLMDVDVSDDEACGWTWRLEPQELQDLLAFLVACSARTWAEIEADRTGVRNRHKKHHDHEVSDICAQAQRRLYQLTDESQDKILRLRYGGEKRLWGVRDRAVFRIVWADLLHKVYPLDPH